MQEPDSHADEQPDATEVPTRRIRRRRLIAAAAGTAVAIGAGVAVFAYQAQSNDTPVTADRGHEVGVESSSTTDGTPSADATTTGSATPSTTATPAPAGTTAAVPPSFRPTASPPTGAPKAALTVREDVAVNVSKSASASGKQTLRIVSAHGDLTGQHEMAFAADEGQPVAGARCTQNFRFSPDGPAEVKPTMMLCWRFTKDKSVYVIAVDREAAPKPAATAAVVNRVFNELG